VVSGRVVGGESSAGYAHDSGIHRHVPVTRTSFAEVIRAFLSRGLREPSTVPNIRSVQ